VPVSQLTSSSHGSSSQPVGSRAAFIAIIATASIFCVIIFAIFALYIFRRSQKSDDNEDTWDPLENFKHNNVNKFEGINSHTVPLAKYGPDAGNRMSYHQTSTNPNILPELPNGPMTSTSSFSIDNSQQYEEFRPEGFANEFNPYAGTDKLKIVTMQPPRTSDSISYEGKIRPSGVVDWKETYLNTHMSSSAPLGNNGSSTDLAENDISSDQAAEYVSNPMIQADMQDLDSINEK
jgi:hypothetical protein